MNKLELTPLWKSVNNNLSSISSTIRASLLNRVMKDYKLSFSPYSMVSRLDEERLCLFPPMKLLTNNLLNSSKELTVYLAEPHSRWAFKGGRENSTHNLVWNPLKVYCSLESSNMIKRVMHSIIRI